ncbi:(Fe-S)-binding protein [candidate division WOR-3 bacterium]|nr:(Fe-S)-binding protein [candidate division WOR-3 bacterium]
MSTATLNENACIQCGRCSGGCPVSIKSSLNPRRLVYYSLNKLLPPPQSSDETGLWECTTCATCNLRCPKQVEPAQLIVELRSKVIESGRMASSVQAALEGTYLQGNPWSRPREKRYEWARGLDLKVLKPGDTADVLLFVCCTSCYDPRCQESARALVAVLRAAGVGFGVLGDEETCCCSEQLRMGEAGMFDELARTNVELLNSRRVNRIVTVSPHCFNSLNRDYQGLRLPVVHYSQFLAALLDDGRLKLSPSLAETVTYHDPCYLGKQNKVYDEPRRLLKALAGDRFVEFDRSRETSLCCEGGGGRLWTESASKGRLAETRVLDAVERGAAVIASACPFCLLTLEDAIKTTNTEGRLRARDLAELLAGALQPGPADDR